MISPVMLLPRCLVCALALLASSTPLRAQTKDASAVCEVVAVSGEVWLGDPTAGSSGRRALRQGERLLVGAELHTGNSGRVRLRFEDGSTLVLADRSTLTLERATPAGADGKRDLGLLLHLGLIGQRVKPGGGRWEVRTPTAVTAVRGTEFLVEVAQDLSTAVHVQSGEVTVQGLPAPGVPQLRSLKPRRPVLLQRTAVSTRCDDQGQCSDPIAWQAERVQTLQQRIGEF